MTTKLNQDYLKDDDRQDMMLIQMKQIMDMTERSNEQSLKNIDLALTTMNALLDRLKTLEKIVSQLDERINLLSGGGNDDE